ncbi:MAG: L-histidine N(alpha)-methyltransferase [Polyangiaceae bacterium]|nr:L-histidine N(alpha)-methyltransferase [Polyangiaceae bacterium]
MPRLLPGGRRRGDSTLSRREIVDGERLFVELGCGSARKVKLLFDAALRGRASTRLTYTPIDLSKGALSATKAEIEESYPDG